MRAKVGPSRRPVAAISIIFISLFLAENQWSPFSGFVVKLSQPRGKVLQSKLLSKKCHSATHIFYQKALALSLPINSLLSESHQQLQFFVKSVAFSFSCIFLYVPTAHVAFQFAAPHIFPHTPASLSADFDI